MKKLFLFFIAASITFTSIAQDKKPVSKSEVRNAEKQERKNKINNLIRQQEEGALVFNKQNVFGFRLNTDGWGMFYEKGYLKSVQVTNLFSLEFAEKKHPKEKRLNNVLSNGNFVQFGNPFVYGKQNVFYQLKPTFGQQRLVGGKTNKNGVAIHAIYAGGISLGLERPYYVKVPEISGNQTRDIKYTVADSVAFLTPGNIIQGTGLKYGWKDLKIVPGAHAKIALRFDYGRFNEMVSAIEVGLNVEAYSRKVSIMLLNPNEQFFFNSYVAIIFGKRK